MKVPMGKKRLPMSAKPAKNPAAAQPYMSRLRTPRSASHRRLPAVSKPNQARGSAQVPTGNAAG